MPDVVLSALCELTHLMLRTNMKSRYNYYPHPYRRELCSLFMLFGRLFYAFSSKYVMSLHIPAHLEVRDSHVKLF